jgi:hypothetical protein
MKRLFTIWIMVLMALSAVGLAQDTNYAVRIPCDFQDATHGLPDLPLLQGSAPCLAVDPMRGVYPIPSDPLTTVQLILAPTATGTYFVATNAYLATNDSYYIQLGTIGTNSCPTNSTTPAPWFYTVLFSRNGGVYWSGNGKAYIEAAAFTGTNGLVWQEWEAGTAKDTLARDWIADLSNVVENIEVGSTVYGVTNGSAYRGDWGHSVSGRVVTVEGWGDHSTNGYIDAAAATSIVEAVQAASTTNDFPLIEFGAGGSGTITGATVAEGSPLAVETNAGVLAFTIPASGGGGAAVATNAPVPVTLSIANGQTGAIYRGTASYYYINLTNAAQTILFDAGFDATVGASILIDVRGTNSLAVIAGCGPVSWTDNVWLRDGATVPIIFSKPFASTNWTGSEL